MTERDRINALAEALWRYDHPNGGSIYHTYESLPNIKKTQYRQEAYRVSLVQDGLAFISTHVGKMREKPDGL